MRGQTYQKCWFLCSCRALKLVTQRLHLGCDFLNLPFFPALPVGSVALEPLQEGWPRAIKHRTQALLSCGKLE